MTIAKLKSAVELADNLRARIENLTRVKGMINPADDAMIGPGQLERERAMISAASGKAAIDGEINRLQNRLNDLMAKIEAAGQQL